MNEGSVYLPARRSSSVFSLPPRRRGGRVLLICSRPSFTPDHAEPPFVPRAPRSRPGMLEVSQAAVTHPRQRFAQFKSQTRVAKVKGRVLLVMDACTSVLFLFVAAGATRAAFPFRISRVSSLGGSPLSVSLATPVSPRCFVPQVPLV